MDKLPAASAAPGWLPLSGLPCPVPAVPPVHAEIHGDLSVRSDPSQRPLLKALEVLRQINREEQTRVPSDAPRSFVRPTWAPFVFTDGGIDRWYYELCALLEPSFGLQALV